MFGLIPWLIELFISGLIMGGLGRLLLPGKDPMGLGMTFLVGLGGSILGFFAGYFLIGRPGGLLLALLATMFLVYLVRRSRRGRVY
jgi:uncharacterized membrane protein YeaQ/YmgE (transglycosylase-associated protein family)